MKKSALSRLFNYELDQCSPVKDDLMRKVNFDEDGNEFITYSKVDYPKLQTSLGSVTDWSLDALLKAGINPDFPIHTGIGTRIEGIETIAQAEAVADSLLADIETENNNN